MKFTAKSLRVSILMNTIITTVLAAAVLILISFISGKKAVNSAYINQLRNVTDALDYNLEKFYESHIRLSKFLAVSDVVVNAARTKDYTQSNIMLKKFFDETGDLENLFISTPDEDTEIVSAGQTKSIGVKWAGTGFDENISQTLKGQVHISAPYKSPVTERAVVLVTAPIRYQKQIIGILGLPFDLQTYSVDYLKKTKIGQTGYVFVAGLESKHIIAHPTQENIFNPDTRIDNYSWGRGALDMSKPNGTIEEYDWEGQAKFLTFYRNEKYGYIAFSTIYVHDIQRDVSSMFWFMFTIGLIAVVVAMGIIFMFVTYRFKPLHETIARAKDLAEGEADLTQRIIVSKEDEIGELAGYFNKFIERIQGIVIEVKENTENISSAATQFSSVATEMATISDNVTAQAGNVASATEQVTANIANIASASEEMSVNISTVSSTAEQMSQNMTTVASSTEEMSVSIHQIADNAKDASKVADQAVEKAAESTRTMSALGTAAEEIGKVTEVIKRIADKTNLLALNATIEAASAGDAGKGFAVVANEIKELANQSAQAAEDIANRIKGVQANTTDAIKVIDEVAVIIKSINEAVIIITNSVEQQSMAANDISSNILEAKGGVNNIANAVTELSKAASDMSINAGEAAKGSNEVSANIADVNRGAIESNNGAQQVSSSSEDLARIANTLLDIVNRFKLVESETV